MTRTRRFFVFHLCLLWHSDWGHSMISRSTGEATFQDLRILPQAALSSANVRQTHPLPLSGWLHHVLSVHRPGKDWLVLAYTLGPKVPMYTAEVLRHLHAHDPEPSND